MTPDFDFQDLIEDLFRLTGKKMSANDPLAIAAFFYSRQLHQASEAAASRIEGAAEGTHAAAGDATDAAKEAAAAAAEVAAVCRRLEAERAAFVLELKEERARSEKEAASRAKALADGIEARLKKAVRDASRAQSTQEGPPQGWRGVLAGIAFGVVATAGAVGVACNFSFSWTGDAALGRVLKAVYPTLSASSREEFSRQYEKLHPR